MTVTTVASSAAVMSTTASPRSVRCSTSMSRIPADGSVAPRGGTLVSFPVPTDIPAREAVEASPVDTLGAKVRTYHPSKQPALWIYAQRSWHRAHVTARYNRSDGAAIYQVEVQDWEHESGIIGTRSTSYVWGQKAVRAVGTWQ
jgi:hypothetical protein